MGGTFSVKLHSLLNISGKTSVNWPTYVWGVIVSVAAITLLGIVGQFAGMDFIQTNYQIAYEAIGLTFVLAFINYLYKLMVKKKKDVEEGGGGGWWYMYSETQILSEKANKTIRLMLPVTMTIFSIVDICILHYLTTLLTGWFYWWFAVIGMWFGFGFLWIVALLSYKSNLNEYVGLPELIAFFYMPIAWDTSILISWLGLYTTGVFTQEIWSVLVMLGIYVGMLLIAGIIYIVLFKGKYKGKYRTKYKNKFDYVFSSKHEKGGYKPLKENDVTYMEEEVEEVEETDE